MPDDIARADQVAGRLAMLSAEVREHADRPENADIRGELLEAVAIFEKVINQLAKPRPGSNGFSPAQV
jgi:hypothetical protein